MKPFSTYPEDRAKLLDLARKIQAQNTDAEDTLAAADKLSDLVIAILEDEAPAAALDAAWENRPGGFDGPTAAD